MTSIWNLVQYIAAIDASRRTSAITLARPVQPSAGGAATAARFHIVSIADQSSLDTSIFLRGGVSCGLLAAASSSHEGPAAAAILPESLPSAASLFSNRCSATSPSTRSPSRLTTAAAVERGGASDLLASFPSIRRASPGFMRVPFTTTRRKFTFLSTSCERSFPDGLEIGFLLRSR